MHDHDTQTMAIKAVIAWVGVGLAHLGIERWSDLAAMLASIYTFFLLCEWVWKHIRARRVERD